MMIHSGVPVGSHPASPLSTNTGRITLHFRTFSVTSTLVLYRLYAFYEPVGEPASIVFFFVQQKPCLFGSMYIFSWFTMSTYMLL